MNNSIHTIVITALATSILTSTFFLSLERKTSMSSPREVTASTTTDSPVVNIVKKANPSVVSITITENIPVIERYYRIRSPFGIFGIPINSPQSTREVEVGSGSGFFITNDGYVLTNRHVVDSTVANYTVLTNDGKHHDARVVYRDPKLDIALLKIEGSGYIPLVFGDSSKLEVGQTVIAIGNALGEFSNTVSVGVVSGLGRSVVAGDIFGNTESLEQAIQTDAAINLGNSGGPLIDLSGNVIGVNVATAASGQNLGFALPSNSIQAAIKSVLQK